MKSPILHSLSEENILPLKPAFHFSTHEDDEFRIEDEGRIQGIFKIWPSDVLSILEWEKMQRNHLTRMIAMKKWLTFIALADRRLQESFESNDHIEKDIVALWWERFAQMEWSFFAFEPFYCIEATVDNKKASLGSDKINTWWEIDLVALMLPGIFGKVIQDCENWEDIERLIHSLRNSFRQDIRSLDGQKFTLLSLISRKLGISFAETLFASKILTIIHGKSDERSEDIRICIETLQRSFRRDSSLWNQKTIDADVNARIRFMNWIPIKKVPEAFQWKWMNYDAVCNSASRLFEMISENPNLIKENHRTWFKEIQPQLAKLDASSARWRFLLQMFMDNCFSLELIQAIKNSRENIWKCIEKKNTQDLFPLGKETTHVDLAQSGWKWLGLFLADEVFWSGRVIETSCIPWTWIQEWLIEISGFSDTLSQLEQANTVEEKIQFWEIIRERIQESMIPESLLKKFENMSDILIFRSSALTEDIEDVGSAPGIFESHKTRNTKKDITLALKSVISSFFSDRAITFREGKWLCHTPLISVLVQSFIEGTHWSVFVTEDGIQIDLSSSNVNILDDATKSFHFELDRTVFENTIQQDIFKISRDAFSIFWAIDMEFIVKESEITILQLRMLNHWKILIQKEETIGLALRDIHISSIDEIRQLEVIPGEQIDIHFDTNIDFNKFQEELSLHIIRQAKHIHSISLPIKIAPTSHFSNIIRTLWIHLLLPR